MIDAVGEAVITRDVPDVDRLRIRLTSLQDRAALASETDPDNLAGDYTARLCQRLLGRPLELLERGDFDEALRAVSAALLEP